ncbi:MAG: sigma-70 family RNA polymerase sigma factor [Deltaproteobacteria bacterium]|nr:sigma-70 family RNA polymerase sigma factor [Deltaproteobacteria bacterium]
MSPPKHPPEQIHRITGQEDRTLTGMTVHRQQEDGALIAAIARRQQEALDQLYERYQAVVYHLALKVLNNRESAEEVVYDVFWQVWREAERYDAQRGSVSAWLATVARSRAIDALRARRGKPAAADNIAERAVATEPVENPEEQTSLAQRAALVRVALESLPADQRTALELSFFNGLSHIEIAEHLREPLGTVKTRIRSAMLKLRERLRPLLGGTL